MTCGTRCKIDFCILTVLFVLPFIFWLDLIPSRVMSSSCVRAGGCA
jgi:hypothetical protein